MQSETLGCVAIVAGTIFLMLVSWAFSFGTPTFDDYCEAMYVRWGPAQIAARHSAEWNDRHCEPKRTAFERKYGW